ncbi:hypothetical protein X777_11572 [Ooceraea biroi]|uniref:DUF4817 domain-containing protein n=1 Tax=Ooceraea biroi TaxID=2015173 RepID=A0A026W246_OOCBI|nr:hypothetical protein X777_11572 [Ooceraea biroi]
MGNFLFRIKFPIQCLSLAGTFGATLYIIRLEYANIVYFYGFCDENAKAARRKYAARCPNRRLLNKSVFSLIFQRLRETGLFNMIPWANKVFASMQNERRTIWKTLSGERHPYPLQCVFQCNLWLGIMGTKREQHFYEQKEGSLYGPGLAE